MLVLSSSYQACPFHSLNNIANAFFRQPSHNIFVPQKSRRAGGGGATTPWTLSPPHYNDSVSDELGGTITAKQLLSQPKKERKMIITWAILCSTVSHAPLREGRKKIYYKSRSWSLTDTVLLFLVFSQHKKRSCIECSSSFRNIKS